MNSEAKEFLLVEYSELRQTFRSHTGQIVADQRAALALTGAFWTWIAIHAIRESYTLVVWIPTLLVLLFILKWWIFHRSIMRLASYFRDVEERFYLPKGLGWSTNYKKYGRDLLAPWTTVFWGAMLLVNVTAAIFAPVHSILTPPAQSTLSSSAQSSGMR